MTVSDEADPDCSSCLGEGYFTFGPEKQIVMCPCVFSEDSKSESKVTFFEDLGRTIDNKLTRVRELLRSLSRLGLD